MILLLLLSFRAPLVKHTPNEHGLNTQTENMYMCFFYVYTHIHMNIQIYVCGLGIVSILGIWLMSLLHVCVHIFFSFLQMYMCCMWFMK